MVARVVQVSRDSLGRSAGTSGRWRRVRRRGGAGAGKICYRFEPTAGGTPRAGKCRGKAGWLRSKGMLERELDDGRIWRTK